MTDLVLQPPRPISGGASSASEAGNLALLGDIGKSVRRVRGNEEPDARGIKTIWHQGKLRTELLTWEEAGGDVVKQELTFLGLVVEYARDKPLRSGTLPLDDAKTGAAGRPASQMISMDARPQLRTLLYASRLLRAVPQRDFYLQHLLKQVNDGINALEMSDSQTIIGNLSSYSKGLATPRAHPGPNRRRNKRALVAGAAAAVILAAGALTWLW